MPKPRLKWLCDTKPRRREAEPVWNNAWDHVELCHPTPQQTEERDTVDECVADDGAEVEDPDAGSNTINAAVKMKLNTFCTDADVRRKLASIVLDANRLIAEAYLFANFHLLRLLHRPRPAVGLPDVPVIDRSFYYRCLLATSVNMCRVGTLGTDFEVSMKAFDALRPSWVGKVDCRKYGQLMSSLSDNMATMATTHLTHNIGRRLLGYLKWRHPTLKKFHKTIVYAVLNPNPRPKATIEQIITSMRGAAQTAVARPRRARAIQLSDVQARVKDVIVELRGASALENKPKYAAKAHLTLPLYFKMLQELEAAKAVDPATRGHTFTLLPTKAGFTISHIPISSMFLMSVLKNMRKERFKGDGRSVDQDALWRKYFNVNLVETKVRKFGGSIVTDGCAVSVLLANAKTCIVCPEEPLDSGTLRILAHDRSGNVLKKGVDPGYTDFITTADGDGNIESYSSAKYYDKAMFFTSNRRTNRWNAETAELVKAIPTCETASLDVHRAHVDAYLVCMPKLLKHRAARGYRNMRFLRYVKKNEALEDVCRTIAPRDKITVVGFGDWSGGAGSPISRRCAGPLQALKLRLTAMENVFVLKIWEHKTSVTCHLCQNRLSNMVARKTDRYMRRDARASKIHKVLHCRSSHGGRTGHCGTTWNRDANAAKNMLELTMCRIMGYDRPAAFCKAPAVS